MWLARIYDKHDCNSLNIFVYSGQCQAAREDYKAMIRLVYTDTSDFGAGLLLLVQRRGLACFALRPVSYLV